MTYYKPSEVAKILQLSTNTITKMFAGKPGVLELSNPKPGRRIYRTLRISKDALDRFVRG